jgi:penicillin-binding protein 1A
VGLVLRRAVLALLAAFLTMAVLVLLLAWAALRVSWAVPDPGAMAGPTELLDRNGATIARFTAEVDREVVDLEDVSAAAQDAVIVAEDARFYEHAGVDPLSLLRAVVTNVRTGGIAQGGSTLTQQYVKSAFVGDERTVLRKIREAVISIQLERDVDKDEILERYLNEVYFGEGAYGIEAAARTYFDVPAAELEAHQAATLAQLLPAPSVRNPRADPAGAQQRRDALLDRMVETGRLDEAAGREARQEDLALAEPRRLETKAPAFTDHVRRQLEHHFGDRVMQTGALTVRTTLDLEAQEALDEVAAERLPGDDAPQVEAAMVALAPDSGDLLAMHAGRETEVGGFNLATMTRRQNGSAFKPFVYAAALEDGLVERGSVRPAPASTTISRCEGHDGGPFTVRGGPGGSTSVHQAMVASVNTTYQLLGCELGAERIVEQARRMGVRNEIPPTASVALGGASHGASVLDMASAFGTFANDGRYCPARSILEITGSNGQSIEVPPEVVTVPGQPPEPRAWSDEERDARPEHLEEFDDGRCGAATHPNVARTATQAMADVVTSGTGTRADIGRPQAGKTGTSQENKDAWYVGYTPELSLAVWVGDAGREGPVESLPALHGFSRVYGGTLPAMMWADAAEQLLEDVEPSEFPEPGAIELAAEDRDGPGVAPAREIPPPPGTPTAEEAPDEAEPDEQPEEAPEPDEESDEEPPAEPDEPDRDPGGEPDGTPPEREDEDEDEECLVVLRC